MSELSDTMQEVFGKKAQDEAKRIVAECTEKRSDEMTEIHHHQTLLRIGSKDVEIDSSIIHLVDALNEYGIKTTHSCEGDDRGYVSIDMENVEVYVGLVNGKQEISFNLRFESPDKPESPIMAEIKKNGAQDAYCDNGKCEKMGEIQHTETGLCEGCKQEMSLSPF